MSISIADLGTIFAIIVLISYSVGDTFGKKVVLRFGYARAAAVVAGLSMIPFVVLFVISPSFAITPYSLLLSLVSGVFYGLGFILLYKSLSTEQTTNTMALSEVFKAFLVIFAFFALGELAALPAGRVAGIVLVFVGAVLVITTKDLTVNKKLIYALFGFIAWAVLWTMMSYAIKSSPNYVLDGLISTLAAFVTGVIATLIVRDKPRPTRGESKPGYNYYAAMVGLFIGIGSLLFAYLISIAQLAVVSSITALTPVVVAIASRRIYLDKLTRAQLIGLLVAIVGAIVMSVPQIYGLF